jgi:hypothetical protein
MKKLLVILAVVTVLSGCSGHCIKLEGGYSGVQGSIEYCIDKPTSENAGKPVLTDDKGNKNIILTEDDVKKINEKIEEKDKDKPKIQSNLGVSPFTKLGYFLKKK